MLLIMLVFLKLVGDVVVVHGSSVSRGNMARGSVPEECHGRETETENLHHFQ